jgi:predicted MFS family arabinose efflux permease
MGVSRGIPLFAAAAPNRAVREQAHARWTLILTIWFFGVLAGAGLGKTIPLVGMVIKLYGAPGSQAPWFISIVTVASVVLAPFGGWLIDRSGERRILALSCLIGILGNLVVVAAGSFAEVMAGRVVEGFGFTGLLVAGTAMMVRVTRGAQRNIAMTLWGTSVPIGVGIAEALSSTLTEGVFQRPFWGHAAALIVGLALVRTLPRLPKVASPHDAFGMFEIYRHSGAVRLGAALTAVVAVQFGIAAMFPLFLKIAYDQPIEIAGPIGAANIALGVLGSIGAGVLLNKKISPLTLGLTAVALVGACGGLTFAPNIGVGLSSLMFLLCCIGAGAAIGLGFAMVPVVAPSPAAYGAAGALCNQLVNLGFVIGPPAAFSALHADTRGGPMALAVGGALLAGLLLPKATLRSGHSTQRRGSDFEVHQIAD